MGRLSIIERFEKYILPEPNSGCWLWAGTLNAYDYGLLYTDRLEGAHRVAYRLFKGPIPPALFTLILAASLCNAATYYVATTGNDSNPGTIGSPFLTIQKGANVAVAGDTVIVRDGTYGPAGNCSNTSSFAVTISTSGSSGSPITFTAEHQGSAVVDSQLLCHSYFLVSGNWIVINGFIDEHGFTGGILSQGTNEVYSHNTFQYIGNFVTNTSGAIVGILTQPGSDHITINGNLFHDIGRSPGSMFNWHDQSIYVASSFVTIVNNIFYNMLAGWAMAIAPATSGTDYLIAYNTISGQACGGCRDGVVQIGDGAGDVLSNFTILGNIFSGTLNGVVANCAPFTYAGTNAFDHNITFGPSLTPPNIIAPLVCAGTVSGLGTITQANNNLANPLFVNSGSFDFHLTASSPAIGAGVAVSAANPDYDGQTRPQGTSWDDGAYEYIAPAGCATGTNGWCVTGLSAIQNNLLGPLIPYGASPWTFGDAAEKGVVDNMAPKALAETPTLGTACPGTVSWSQGNNIVTTTTSMVSCLSGKAWVVFAWNSIDGVGTGRAQCPISSVTSTTITCSENLFEPTSSGITAYTMPGPGPSGFDFTGWTAENPNVSWNYYDVALGIYRLYYRTLNATYQTQARSYADIQWQWVIDHGYRFVAPRAASMISQIFRALEGHSERFPGLYNWMTTINASWGNPAASPAIDNREAGYTLWDDADLAKTDTDATRHTQYCSWLSTYTNTWNSVQAADGSFPENEFALNPSYVSAPKAFTAPFLYQGAPWREAINVKSLEAAYESLNDTTSQGCNNPTLAASTLTTITKAVTWQNNYGRDSSNRGIYYEVNSQSDDQDSVYPGTGTVSINISSTSLLGSGTNWNTAGYCDGTHFIGLNAAFLSPRTVYKIASCTDNTHATLTVAYGLYGEMSNLSAAPIAFAPPSFTTCHSSATYCLGSNGDRNLTRTVAGDIAWLYAQTLNATYLGWTNEFLSAQLGGPTSGLTSAATINAMTLPCSGPACDGYVADTVAGAALCGVPPCVSNSYLYGNLGKNFGEAFGAPGIDNALAWRLLGSGPALTCSPKTGLTPPNVQDIQLQTNMALHVVACTNDLASDGCGTTSVQRVVTAALGGACVTGP